MEATYTSGLAKSLLKIIIPLVKNNQYFYKVLCQDFFRASPLFIWLIQSDAIIALFLKLNLKNIFITYMKFYTWYLFILLDKYLTYLNFK